MLVAKPAILTDTTKCIGCEECVAACKKANNLGPDLPARDPSGDGLCATRWTSIVTRPGKRYVRKQCRHCAEPACASVCPVGALKKTPEGPVTYDGSKCIGCRYCMMACPYGIPRYDWTAAVPYVRKCIMCHPRLVKGGQPACTEACPQKATIFGDRDMLIAEARGRFDTFPDKYIKKIWGETEVGGTSVLYISDIPINFLSWTKDLGEEPLPEKTWRVLKTVPPLFVGAGAVMGSVYWVIERRMKLAGKDEARSSEFGVRSSEKKEEENR